MKVLISGIPGSGKTTLAKVLSEDLGVPLVPEDFGAISAARDSFYSLRAAGAGEQDLVTAYRKVLDAYVTWMNDRAKAYRKNAFVADRSEIDLYREVLRNEHESCPKELLGIFERRLRDLARDVDRVVLLQPLDTDEKVNESGLTRRGRSYGTKRLNATITAGIVLSTFQSGQVLSLPGGKVSFEDRMQMIRRVFAKA